MRLFTLRRPLIDSVRDALGLICQGCARSVPSWLPTPPPGFSQVFILKVVKVLCFDTLLQVFILNELEGNIMPTIHLCLRLYMSGGVRPCGMRKNKKTSDEAEVGGT